MNTVVSATWLLFLAKLAWNIMAPVAFVLSVTETSPPKRLSFALSIELVLGALVCLLAVIAPGTPLYRQPLHCLWMVPSCIVASYVLVWPLTAMAALLRWLWLSNRGP